MVFKKMTFFAFAMTFFAAGFAEAKAGSRSIVCQQDYTDYDQNPVVSVQMSKLVIKLDKNGNAESLQYHRIKDHEMAELKLKFDTANATISHSIEKNRTDGIDEETHQPIYQWGIENVEVIKAIAKDGSGFKISINDHRYVGPQYGSTTFLIKDGQETELPHGGEMMIICEGPLRLK